MREKSLLERAIGDDEPPLALDFDVIERAGRRARHRKPLASLIAVAAAVAVIVAAVPAALGHGVFGIGSVDTAGQPGQLVAPTDRSIAYCYRTADITSTAPDQHIPVGIAGSGPAGKGDAAAAIMDICHQTWQDNYHGWLPAALTGKSFAVPPLSACVLTSHAAGVEAGAVGVFPGGPDTCARLGLPAARI